MAYVNRTTQITIFLITKRHGDGLLTYIILEGFDLFCFVSCPGVAALLASHPFSLAPGLSP